MKQYRSAESNYKFYVRVYIPYLILFCCILLILTTLYQARKIHLLEDKFTIQYWDNEQTKNSILWKLTDKQDEAARCFERMKEREKQMNSMEVKMKLQEEQLQEVESENKQLKQRIRSLERETLQRQETITEMESALQQGQTQRSQSGGQLKLNNKVNKQSKEVFGVQDFVDQAFRQQDGQGVVFVNKDEQKYVERKDLGEKKHLKELNGELEVLPVVKSQQKASIFDQPLRSEGIATNPDQLISQEQDQFQGRYDPETVGQDALQKQKKAQNNKYQSKPGVATFIDVGGNKLILEN
eukprot:TRINITY_DN1853_c0_g2_i10.p1 TRINITY_DN1853_c0_g2~~TRINITY_DN1853_c0_g2_i10.p1  ORF type:complete len:297 (+),score=50.00 TRINITY_DN1853_c0_g2_i10:69-959(+)